MPSETELVLNQVASAFAELHVSFVVGGSIASSVYGFPRTTQDIDILADLGEEEAQKLVDQLQGTFYIDLDSVRDAIRRKSSFNIIHFPTMVKVDIFIVKFRSWAAEEMRRMRPHRFGSDPGALSFPLSSPEDNILHKLEWFRLGGNISERQWNDVLGILRVQGSSLDFEYLQQWAAELGLTDLLQKAQKEALGN